MRLFLYFLLLSGTVLAQIPTNLQNIDPSNVSTQDLKSLGLSDNDLESILKSDDEKEVEKNEQPKKPINTIKIKPDSIIKATPSNPKNENQVFGKSYFDKNKISIYEKASHLKAPSNYVLGNGDEISISIWGFSEHEGLYTLDNTGSISPKLVGKIYLKGMEYGKAKSLIKSRFGKVYNLKNSQINIELNYSKVIRINIVGEVKNPGTYSVHSVNSAFSILSLAGGLNKFGSVRSVDIKRSGKVIKSLDLYDFLTKNKPNQDFFLLDNDYLVVNSSEKIISISGEVQRPMKYELKQGETLSDLIKFSGGLSSNAYKRFANIQRVIENEVKLIEIELFDENGKFNSIQLLPGDMVIIKPIPNTLRNYVKILGEVHIPGKYSLNDSLDLRKLILKANGLTKEAYSDKAYILRQNDNLKFDRIFFDIEQVLKGSVYILLKEFDEVTIFSKSDFIDSFTIEVKGAVRSQSKHIYSEGMTINDALFLSGGLKPEAASKKIEISRIFNFEEAIKNNSSTRTIIKTIDISNDLKLLSDTSFKLKPNDIIFIRSVSGFELQRNVILNGEVNFPGTYSLIKKNETLLDVLERGGGPTDWAFLEGATLTRKNGNLGILVLDLKKLLKGKKEYNYVLKEGDVVYIPKIRNYVSISGQIEHPNASKFGVVNTPFVKRKSANFFVKQYCGGFTKRANKKKLYVEIPGGQIKKTKTYLFFIKKFPKISMGDKIHVPAKKEKEKKEKKEINWNNVIEGATVKITGVLTLWVLANTALN